MISSNKLKVIVGLGATGLSVARFLSKQGQRFVMLDTRDAPANLAAFKSEFPDIPVELGELQADTLLLAEEIIVSPGLSIEHPALQEAKAQGISIVGDIQLFANAANAPIIAITGSNGKSTVTTLLGEMAEASGLKVGVGGNLGKPALDLISEDAELYVLELSSFQLETVSDLSAEVAVVLNLSPDHLDRYPSMMQYHRAKHRIFQGVKTAVVNRDEPLSFPLLAEGAQGIYFGLKTPDLNDYGLVESEQKMWLAKGLDLLMPVEKMALKGRHNISNALAALALGGAINLPMGTMLQLLERFAGLPHRCQTVKTVNGVHFINDSKATNVGATIAAIDGLAEGCNIVLLAGGQGKNQNFEPLAQAVKGKVKTALVFGEQQQELSQVLNESTKVVELENLESAVEQSQKYATAGDVVLLSPACASFDQFSSFEHRGECFVKAVEALV